MKDRDRENPDSTEVKKTECNQQSQYRKGLGSDVSNPHRGGTEGLFQTDGRKVQTCLVDLRYYCYSSMVATVVQRREKGGLWLEGTESEETSHLRALSDRPESMLVSYLFFLAQTLPVYKVF